MSIIRVISSTMGQSTRASLGNGRLYRWNGTAQPGDPSYRGESPPAPRAATEMEKAKEKRLREFCAHMEAGRTVAEAAELLQVSIATARTYERERKAALRGAGRDA